MGFASTAMEACQSLFAAFIDAFPLSCSGLLGRGPRKAGRIEGNVHVLVIETH